MATTMFKSGAFFLFLAVAVRGEVNYCCSTTEACYDSDGKECPSALNGDGKCPPGCAINADYSDTTESPTSQPTASPTAAPSEYLVDGKWSLDASCQLPYSYGGGGDCLSACDTVTLSSKPGCELSAEDIDYAAWVDSIDSKTCTQSTDSRCTTEALTALVGEYGAVKAAFCNDEYLVIMTSKGTSNGPYLDDAKTPPSGTDDVNGECVTRSTSVTPTSETYKIPLYPTALSTASVDNNKEAYENGAGDGDGYYLVQVNDSSISYGLPSAGPIGVAISGQEIYPIYNNRATQTLQDCEVDACNEHVGQGGGQPHFHGDPFSSTDGVCLYGPANYTSETDHPPMIGWSLDGFNIYGRHLYTTSLGFDTALDTCGGHEHDGIDGYHYHAQVITAVTDALSPAVKEGLIVGIEYATFTPGVHDCWKGNISAVPGGSTEFFTKDKQSDYAKPCDGMTEYYAAEGITIRGTTANLDELLSKAAKAASVDALLSEELAHAKLTGWDQLETLLSSTANVAEE